MPGLFNQHMLMIARQLRGLSQADLAEKAGVSQALVSKVENGLFAPDDTIVEKFARVLSLPDSFFCQPDAIFGLPVSVHHRKKASVGRHQMDRATAEFNVRVAHLKRLIEAADLQQELELPRLDPSEYDESPERVADLLRRHWLVPAGPMRNLTGYMERAGVIVLWCDLSGVAIDGVSFRIPRLPPLVFVDQSQPADRMRFTLAHELGHLVMHRLPGPDMEREANEFASALLMPRADIGSAFVGRVTLASLAPQKRVWQVSIQSLLMRAEATGAITSNQARYLWVQIGQMGFRRHEPSELDIEYERPSVLNELINIHLKDLGYTVPELAKALNMESEEFASWYRLGGKPPTLRVV